MARLVINKTGTDVFVQLEWVDNAGVHSRRVTEDMPIAILNATKSVLTWADDYELNVLAPKVSKDAEIAALENSLQKVTDRLKDLKR